MSSDRSIGVEGAARRRRVLFGLVFTPTSLISGLNTFNSRLIQALGDKVELNLLVGDSGNPENLHVPGIRWGEMQGLPALFARKDDRTIGRFTMPGESKDIDAFIDGLAAHMTDRGIDLIHIGEWETNVGLSLLAAANRAAIPWVITVLEYRPVCAQYFLFEKGLRPCSGPDPAFRKCSRCLATQRAWWGGKATLLKGYVKEALYSLGLTGMLPWYQPPEAYRKRCEAIRRELAGCAAITSFCRSHADRLGGLLGIPPSRFYVTNYATSDPGEGYRPRQTRFSYPLRFGWINRTCREWGTFFLAEAWRRAALDREKAQLWLYAIKGTERTLRQEGYGRLIDSGSLVVKEERVFGRENEVCGELAGVICASLWYENGWSPEPFAQKVPHIAPDHGAHGECFRDGERGFHYRKGDADSLAALLRRLTDNPHLLKEMADRTGFLPEYGYDEWGQRHIALYERILSGKSAAGTDPT